MPRLGPIFLNPQRLVAALRWAALALMLFFALRLSLNPDPRDDLRHVDRLIAAGQYYAALQISAPLSADPNAPAAAEAALRVAVLRTVRGEPELAERALAAAMQRGLPPAEYDLALLYLGHARARRGDLLATARAWNNLERCDLPRGCALRGPMLLLRAEAALRAQDVAAALADYSAALVAPLPPEWFRVAALRRALLLAPRDLAAAQADLQAQPPTGAAFAPLLRPLLPQLSFDLPQLQVAFDLPAPERQQVLGQIALQSGMTATAEQLFRQVPRAAPEGPAAAAYAAYARWQSGDRANGLAELEALAHSAADEPRARALLALAYLATADTEAAQAEIQAIEQLRPIGPDAHLAWANWHAANREYDRAALEYRTAYEEAAEAEKGRYAHIAAGFALTTGYNLCDEGRIMAEVAATAQPNDLATQTSLAAVRYRCNDFAGTVAAAQRAAELGVSVGATYYLGVAQAALGDQVSARETLIRAADLAPASVWRKRAEEVLGVLR